MLKFQHFEILIFFDFADKIFSNQQISIFPKLFFWSSKILFFLGVEIFSRYSFDVKISDLLIYNASRFIRARQTRFLAR